MTKLYKYTAIIIFFFFYSCAGKQSQTMIVKENLEMKAILQGTWMDEDTETPMICIKGDSIHYMTSGTLPVAFRIIEDSLITYGTEPTSYYIVKQNEYMLWLQSDMGGIIKMNKWYLNSLSGCHMYIAMAIFVCHLCYCTNIFCR